MNRLATFRENFGAMRVVVFFLVVYLITQIAIGSILHPLGAADFFRAQTTFSRDTYLAYVAQWQAAGLIERYYGHYWLDFVLPVWYALLLGSMLAHGLQRNRMSARWNGVLVIPFVAGAMDITENVFHLIFLSNLSGVSEPMIVMSALAANTKWALAGASVILVVALYGRAAGRRTA